MLKRAPSDVLSFERGYPNGTVQVHLNLGGVPREIGLGPAGRILVSTVCHRASHVGTASHIALAPYEGIIVTEGSGRAEVMTGDNGP